MERAIEHGSGNGAGGWHETVGRAGFVAKGLVYGLVGVIAIGVALDGGGGKQAKGQTGALRELAGSGFGKVVLILLAIGLAAYAIYRLIEVFVGSASEEGEMDKVERAGSIGRFVIYAGLCFTAIGIVSDAGGGGSGPSKTTSTVFDLPAGVALVFIAGLVVIGVGLYQGYQALSRDFEDDLETGRMGETTRRVMKPLGVIGHAARAVVFVLIGAFLIKASVEHDSSEAIGLDGALREVAQESYGSVLLVAVGIGLLLFGAYTLLEARYRKL